MLRDLSKAQHSNKDKNKKSGILMREKLYVPESGIRAILGFGQVFDTEITS